MKVYRARYIWDGVELHENAALYIEDGKVVRPGEGEVIDLGPKLVMPGFVNAHTHVAMVLMRGLADGLSLHSWLRRVWSVEERLDEEALKKASLYGLVELVSSGVTSFVDFYNIPPMVWALKRLRLRAMLTLAFMDRVEYMEEESWKRVGQVERYIRMVEEVGARLALGPHAPYTCSPEMLKEISKLSKKYGLKVHTHLSETEEEVSMVKEVHGKEPLQVIKDAGLLDENLIAAHGVHLTEKEMQELGRARATVVHCPRSNARLASGMARIGSMLKYGVNVALGTDGPASSEDFDMMEEARLALYLWRSREREPVQISQVLRLLFENGARVVGSGVLRPGMPADFIVFDLRRIKATWDPFTSAFYTLGRQDLEEVYVGGRPVYRNGQIEGLDVEGLRREIDEIRGQLK